MASISFPSSPSNGDTYSYDGLTYQYNSTKNKWSVVATTTIDGVSADAIDQNLVPSANVTHDLGTSDKAFRDLYLSGSSINLGDATISSSGSAVTLPAGSTVGGVTIGTGSGGATQYANTSLLPTSGLTAGEFAFVGNTLFMTNGSGWYSVALVNQSPELTLSTSSISLGSTGNTINFTFTATDPDGPTPTVTATTTANSAQANVTVYSSNSTVTVENLSADNYSANITVTASDGINQTFSTVTLTVAFLSELWDETVLSIGTSGYAYNLSSAVDTGTNISLSSTQEHFSSDGLTLITVNSSTQVGSHDLSTAYDMSTITASQAYNISEETSVEDARFSSDGTKMYVVGITNDTVYQYSLSTAFDVSSASYDSVSFAISGQESAPRGLAFSSDGTKMYISGNSGDDINEYDLSTAWDLSTASYSQVFSFGDYQQTPLNIEFSSDGTKLFIYGSSAGGSHPEATSGNRIIDRWDLSTAWDVSTMTYHSYLNDPISANVSGMTFNNDGTTLYVSTGTVVNVFDMSVNNNSNFVDRSTNTHTVTPSGTPTQTAFHPYLDNWSVEFNGTSDYIRADNALSTLTSASDPWTIEMWFWSDGNDFTGPAIPIGINASNNGDNVLLYRGGSVILSATTYNFSSTMPQYQWVHIAMTFDGTTLKVYHDGTEVSSDSVTFLTAFSNCVLGIATEFDAANGGSAGNFTKGWMSNFRVSNNVRYTSSFTPSTSKLSSDANTLFLGLQSNRFIDESSANVTVTPYSSPEISSFNPFGQGSEYAVGGNKGSVRMIQTNTEFLVTPQLASLSSTLLASNFTTEAWVYLEEYASAGSSHIWNNSEAHSDGQTALYIYSDGRIMFGKVGVNEIGSTSGTIKLNRWHHVAMVRNGATTRIYVDGADVANGASSTYLNSSNVTHMKIGRSSQNSGDNSFPGYISDFKVTPSAVYTSAFTPPTAPVGSTNASLYLPMDNAGIFDKTSNYNLTLFGDTSTSTTQTKYADTAMYFDGTGDFVRITNMPIFGTNDFTVEGWIYNLSGGASRNIADARTGSSWTIQAASNEYKVYDEVTASYIHTTTGSFETNNLNSWIHIAWCRSGSTSRFFINGTQVGSDVSNSSNYQNTSVRIGSRYSEDQQYFQGYIENFQILKGIAKYTSNFTAPTEEQGRSYQAES